MRNCDCPDGTSSIERCAEDGQHWETCACDLTSDSDISPDSDRDIETDGDDHTPEADIDETDADPDGWPLPCDWTQPFAFVDVRLVTELSTDGNESNLTLTEDGLTIHFSTNIKGERSIFYAQRPSQDEPFGEPQLVPGEVNSDGWDERLSLTPDGLVAYFGSIRKEGVGGADVWRATRGSLGDPFVWVELVVAASSPLHDWDPILSPDGLALLVARPAMGDDQDVLITRRASLEEPFDDMPVPIAMASTSDSEADPSLTSHNLVLLFISSRADGIGGEDLYYSLFEGGDYGPAQLLPGDSDLNTVEDETEAVIGPDGCEVFFCAIRPDGLGGTDIYRATFEAQ